MPHTLLHHLTPALKKHQETHPHRPFFLAIDGRSGAGKTTLAQQVALHYETKIFHLDAIFPGWDGFEKGLKEYIFSVLIPLKNTGKTTWTPWNWNTASFMKRETLYATPFMIFEGTGSSDLRAQNFLDYTVWITCPYNTRKTRALARDGITYVHHWDQWEAQENAWVEKNNPEEHSTLVLSAYDENPKETHEKNSV